MISIESAHNPKFRRWLSLLDGAGIRAEGLALLPGPKVIEEVLRDDPARVREILLPPKTEALAVDVPQVRLGGDLFRALDVVGTKRPLAVIHAPTLEDWDRSPPRGLELILALSDPGNLGACLRSAEAFGVSRVILTAECASPYLPRALRGSAGSALRLPLSRTGPITALDLDDVVGLDSGGTPLDQFAWPKDSYLVLGEEGRGLPAGLRGPRVAIPMAAPVESLNATVAASLALYAYRLSARA